MRIEHSGLCNEFISFWFETRIDDELRYETFIDYLRSEWYTCPARVDGQILLSGKLPASMSEAAQIESVKSDVSAGIMGGRL